MYPLKVVLIGNDESLLPVLRRELSNQYVEIDQEYPDVTTAIENFNLHYDENRLFIFHVDGDLQGNTLKRLNGAFAGRPILALLDGSSNSLSVVHAMRDGAAQVVMLPLEVTDLHEALTSVAIQFGHAASKAKVIAVTGAHGGVGSTTLAVNLAYEIAQTYKNDAIVAELSFNCGVLASFLNIRPKFTTLDLVQSDYALDVYSIKKALVPFGDRLSILSGPLHATRSAEVNPIAVTHLISTLRQLAQVVILDVPSGLDEAQLSALDAADVVILVADQTLPSLQLTVESLQLGIRSHSPRVVINRYDPKIKSVDYQAMKKALSVEELWTIALDHESIVGAVNCGQPLRLVYPKSRALADIDSLAQELVGSDNTPHLPAGITGMFGNLAHVLGIC
jgi:pilus assembly protein CpaE